MRVRALVIVMAAALAITVATLPGRYPYDDSRQAAVVETVASVAGPASTKARQSGSRCKRGLVALTFDDGPTRVQTVRLVKILDRLNVKATFFMVGWRVKAAPGLARMVHQHGHVVANHTWNHPRLPILSDRAVRDQLRGTRSWLQRAGAHPGHLMRPPYGSTTPRVRGLIRAVGMRAVLWDIDSRDWESGSSRQIADRVLAHLRPHRSNIVLQHDGVPRSWISVGAVERIVRTARSRGYCFTTLGPDGRPARPVGAKSYPAITPAAPTPTSEVDPAQPWPVTAMRPSA